MLRETGPSGRRGRALTRLLASLFALITLVIGLDLGLRNLSASTVSCHTILSGSSLQPTAGCQTQQSPVVVLYLPGVTARASEASSPVINTWLDVGDVQLVDYVGDRFDPKVVAQSVAQILAWDAQHYNRVHVYAESLGCFVAADALADVSRGGTFLGDRLRLLLGDCPSGPETMRPDSSLGAAFYAGPVAESIADGFAGVAHWITHTAGPDGTVLWSWSSASTPAGAFEPGVDVARIQAQQRQNSAGFSLAAFTDQVRYMRLGVPSLAALSGGSVAYIMARPDTDGSAVQPQAMLDWVAAAKEIGVCVENVPLDFPSRHIDYWAWPEAWNRVFREHLAVPQP